MKRPSTRSGLAITAAAGLLAIVHAAAAQQPPFPSRPAAVDGDPIATYVAEASQRFGIPDAWIRAVMRVESAGEVGTTSSAGAMGLMQVMPETYATLRATLGLGADAYDPHDNIMAGAAYLREMHDRYGDGGFLAAYNAGPARYDEYRAGGRQLPSETILYMARLGPMLGVTTDPVQVSDATAIVLKPEEAPIFVALGGGQSASGSRQKIRPKMQPAAAEDAAGAQANALFTARPATPEDHAAANPSARPLTTKTQDERTVATGSPQPVDQSDGIIVHRSPVRSVP